MKPRVSVPGGKLMLWEPVVDSDDDGVVNQPSFILPSDIKTDGHGVPIYGDKQEPTDAKEAANEAWQDAFGETFQARKAIRDGTVQTHDRSVEPAFLRAVLVELEKDVQEVSLAYACDQLVDIAIDGMPRAQIGATRENVCGHL